MQDVAGDGDSATSDGIYVYMYSAWTNAEGIAAGYSTTATSGQVQEYYGATELYNPSPRLRGRSLHPTHAGSRDADPDHGGAQR